jgi:hypothetical protein
MEGAQMSHDGGGSSSHSGGHGGSQHSSPHHDGAGNSGISWFSSYPRRQRGTSRYSPSLIAWRIAILIAALLILKAILHI